MSLIVAFFWYAQYVYMPFQTPYLTAQGVSASFVGVIVGAYGVSQMILRFPIGMLADTVNQHKLFIFLGCFASGAASLLRIIFDNGAGFLAANIFSGFAASVWISMMVLYLSFYDEKDQQKATGKILVFNNIGNLAAFATGMITYEYIGMKWMCVFSIIAAFTGAVCALFLKKNSSGGMAASCRPVSILSVLKRKNLIVFSLLAIIPEGIHMTTTMSFTNQILRDMGGSSAIIGFSSVIYMISAICFSGFVSTKVFAKRKVSFWVAAGFAAAGAYCLLVPFSTAFWQILLLQILPGISIGMLLSCLTSEAMAGADKSRKSTAMGFFQAVYSVGLTVFPIFTGSIVEHASMKTGYMVLALFGAAGMICAVLYYGRVRAKNKIQN